MAAINLFHYFSLGQENGNAVDLDTDTIKAMIVDNTRAPVQATDADMTSIAANEVSAGSSYSAGGPTLANCSVALSAGVVKFDADDVTIAIDASTGFSDGYYVIIYKYTGTTSTEIPIAYAALGGPVGNVSGPLEIQFDGTNGIFIKSIT